MNRTFAATCLILLCANLTFAQAGAICIFADTDGNDCTLTDDTPGVLTVHVVHTLAPGATAVQFAAPKPGCMAGATWLNDTAPWPVTLGDSQTGVSVGFGMCYSSPIHVLSINYQVSGATTPDCAYPVLAHPAELFLLMADCSDNQRVATGGVTYLNSARSCECEEIPVPPVLRVSPVGYSFGTQDSVATLRIQNIGGGTIEWQTSTQDDWIAVDPASGIGEGALTVSVSRIGLLGGHHLGTVTVTSNGGDVDLPISIIVNPRMLAIEPAQLSIQIPGSGVSQFKVINMGTHGKLHWSATADVPWIWMIQPPSGIVPLAEEQIVSVHVTQIGWRHDGEYQGSILVTSDGGSGSILVTVVVDIFTPTEVTTWGRLKALYAPEPVRTIKR